jgi:hydrogenase-4 component F
MIVYFAAIGLLALLIVMISRSVRIISAIPVLHALGAFILSLIILTGTKLPQFYMKNQYFFIDQLNIYVVLISTGIIFFAAIYAAASFDAVGKAGKNELNWGNYRLFNVALNLLLTAIIFALFSNNLALFWIFAELTTLLSVILIATRNVKENIDAALKYIFIASAGMLFAFIGLILLFALSKLALGEGTLNWNVLMQNAGSFAPTLVLVSFAFIFIGFAAKAGIAPFHTWLPHAHSKSPSAISAILSGVVLNIGLYGILRIFLIIKQTSAVRIGSQMMMVFGIFSIAVAAFSMLQQKDLKKLIAFSSIENVGLMLTAMAIGTPLAIFWLLFFMLGHSMAKALLFFSAGILHQQYKSNEQSNMVNALMLQPLASWGLIIGCAAVIGMPPLALFISKFFILSQLLQVSPFILGIVLFLVLIASVASTQFLIRIFSNFSENSLFHRFQTPLGMGLPVLCLILFIIIFGIFIPPFLSNALSVVAGLAGGGL